MKLTTWKELESKGLVKVEVLPDEITDYGNLAGDCFNPKVNPDVPIKKLESDEQDFKDKIERDGVWGIVSSYFDGEKWQFADSVWGFVGDNWKNSGYDEDVKQSAIDLLHKVTLCPMCHRPTKGENNGYR